MKHLTYKVLFTFLVALAFNACQPNSENSETGELSIELTDAKGDFANYTVDVLSLTLTNRNGSIVEVLPESTRVDFAQYVEMSEFLTLATVPSGIYTSATLHLDYNNADIHVEDADGNSVKVDIINDENGNPVTTLSSNVNLEEQKQLRIIHGVPAFLSLDFDLKTSNVVSFDTSEVPSLTVSPTLNADLEPDLNKNHRVRGPLKTVDINAANFDLVIRPFNHKVKENHEKFGSLTIQTDDNTQFEINEGTWVGAAGITAMSELDALAAVIVVGDITLNPRQFMATEVYAGSSVPGGTQDVVKGTVLSRSGNNIVVKGATLIRAGGSILFNDTVTVTLDTTTIVKRQKDASEYTIDDISVGQAVTVFGDLNEDTANLTLDASTGLIRMRTTRLNTSVVDITDFSLNLNKINGRKIALFDFSGTGTDTENDAMPEHYEVDTGVLDTSKFVENSPIEVRGFVTAFGQAPDDFVAKSIISMKTIKAGMQTHWRPFSNTAFSSISETAITLDFTDSVKFHHIGRRHQRLDLTTLDTAFTLVPNTSDNTGLYIIHLTGSKHIHTSFENFAADLQDLMNSGAEAKKIQAKGEFDITTGEFVTKDVRVHLK